MGEEAQLPPQIPQVGMGTPLNVSILAPMASWL